MPQRDDLSGLRIRQGFQQHAIDYTEDRRAGANAQPERKHTHRREARVAAQPARGIAQIRKQLRDRVLPSVGTHLFPDCGSVAEIQPRSMPRLVGRKPARL
jgi:hypothetical protein